VPSRSTGAWDWREYDAHDGSKRQAVQIIADTVQFLGSPDRATNAHPPLPAATPGDDIPF
jgi:single-stranded DNA-binding protein